jgi:hypothetical protein
MKARDDGSGSHLRVVLEFSRDDHPMLFDELVRFPKGQRRVNRLRLLAYDGLLQHSGLQPMRPGAAKDTAVPPKPVERPEGRAQLTNLVFAPDDESTP